MGAPRGSRARGPIELYAVPLELDHYRHPPCLILYGQGPRGRVVYQGRRGYRGWARILPGTPWVRPTGDSGHTLGPPPSPPVPGGRDPALGSLSGEAAREGGRGGVTP